VDDLHLLSFASVTGALSNGSKTGKAILSIEVNPTSHQGSMAAECQNTTRTSMIVAPLMRNYRSSLLCGATS
jgi:hypothetical protein